MDHFASQNKDQECIRRQAVRELLSYHLEFNEEELNLMEILEN